MQRRSRQTAIVASATITALAPAALAQIADGSFELAGPAGPAGSGPWAQTSSNLATPIHDTFSQIPGTPPAPRTGQWWAWFGGVRQAPESASITQIIPNPPAGSSLSFWLRAFTDRTDAADALRVIVDGSVLLTITSFDILPGQPFHSPSAYIQVLVPIPTSTASTRTLTLQASTNGSISVPLQTSFWVDDLSIVGGCYANCDNSTATPILTPADFICFLNKYRAGDPYANCDASTATPTLTPADFICFLNKYRAGC